MALYKSVYYYYYYFFDPGTQFPRSFLQSLLLFFKAHQHKAAGRKIRLDMQNYGCNGNLLCYHGVVERNRIFSLQSHIIF